MNKLTFHGRNYSKDTPKYIERIAAGMRRIVAVVAGLSVIQHNDTLALWVIIGGAVLDEIKNFFGQIATEQGQVSVKFPAEVADQVEVETGPVETPKPE